MNSLPKITIVIPTLNRPTQVLRAINSVNNQTYEGEIRCVIVDSSKDQKTENIIRSNTFSNKNLSIDYFKNPYSKRPIDNWIVGIEEFKTGLGKFLCDDDWLHPEFLMKCNNKLSEYNCDTVISNINLVKVKGDSTSDYYNFKEGLIYQNSVINSLLGIEKMIPVTPTAGLMKSDVLVNSFFESLEHIECTQHQFGFDFFMSYFATFDGNGTYLINESLAYSYAGEDSMTLNVKKAKISYCYLFALLKLIDKSSWLIDNKQRKIIQHKLGSYKLKSFLNKEYKALYYETLIKSKLSLKLLLLSQIKKYIIKVLYLLKN